MANSYSDEKINLVLNEMNKTIYTELKNAGEIKSNELYLLPEDDLETANYATKEDLNNLSTETVNSLNTKAGVDLSNLTDAGNAVIDSRITSLMDTRAIVESGDNYVKFGNGLLVQWGYWNHGLANYFQGTITFPKPFANLPCITASTLRSDSKDLHTYAVCGSLTKTNVVLRCNNTTTSGGSEGIMWIAIGY